MIYNEHKIYKIGDFIIDVQNMRLSNGAKSITLNKPKLIALKILKLLVCKYPEVVKYDEIKTSALEAKYAETNNVHVHIAVLKNQIGFPYIETVRNIGYKLTAQPITVDDSDLNYQETISELKDKHYLYYLGDKFAASIRLIGAADEFFPPETIHIVPMDLTYEMPEDFLACRDEIVQHLKTEAKNNNFIFEDRPNTRLIDYQISAPNETEQKEIKLIFGKIGWYDFSASIECFKKLLKTKTISELHSYVNLDEIADPGIIRNVKLSNIICTATTLITLDGFAIYAKRSRRVSTSPEQFSVIAENMDVTKDRSLEVLAERMLPVPFQTVLRGIEEEVSKMIRKKIELQPRSIFLLGMAFDLQDFHPDLLFMIALPVNLEEFISLYREHKGRDFVEGTLNSVPIFGKRKELNALLNNMWVPSGKASLIRAVNFIDSILADNQHMNINSLMTELAKGNVPSKK